MAPQNFPEKMQEFTKQEIKQSKKESNLGRKLKLESNASIPSAGSSVAASHSVPIPTLNGTGNSSMIDQQSTDAQNEQHSNTIPIQSFIASNERLMTPSSHSKDLQASELFQESSIINPTAVVDENGLKIPKKFYFGSSIQESFEPSATTNTMSPATSPTNSNTTGNITSNTTGSNITKQFGLRVQRQASLVDWNSTRVGRKKSLKSHSLIMGNQIPCQSPAQHFLQNLNLQPSETKEEEYAVGDLVGDYELKQLLSETDNSKVFMAITHTKPKLVVNVNDSGIYKVCLKVMNKRNDNEILIWSSIYHPCVLNMYEFIEFESSFIITSEYCSMNLLEWVRDQCDGGTSEKGDIKRYFSMICHAVDYLHNSVGVIHQDIKLENILVSEDRSTVKLGDFGLSEYYTNLGSHSTSKHNNFQITLDRNMRCKKSEHRGGSVHYMSPEIIMGTQLRLPSSDIWALGCVLYAMVQRKLPFNESYLPRLQMSILNVKYEKVDGEVGNLINGMLCLDLDKRWTIKRILEERWVLGMDQLL